MSGFHTPENLAHMKGMKWEDKTPPAKDPVRTADRDGRLCYNKSMGYNLFHQSAMPFGAYRSVIMERVPAALLLYMEQFNQDNPKFRTICDYVDRHRDEIEERARCENRPIDWVGDFRDKG
jgi:hypothetical protein